MTPSALAPSVAHQPSPGHAASDGGDWPFAPAAIPDAAASTAARERQAHLTKPFGALGRLEALAIWLAGLQGRPCPALGPVSIVVFAADHGIAHPDPDTGGGVSAFPQAVTAQMVMNMAAGGAAISVLARSLGARIELIDLGTVTGLPTHPGIRSEPVGRGTANLVEQPAMTVAAARQAMAVGRAAVARAIAAGSTLFIGGEMGIGNTSAAAALTAALLERPAADLVGPGTGLDAAGVSHKTALIARALARHREHCQGIGTTPAAAPLQTLAGLGGFEIAALTGAFITCAQQRVPMLVDGFIASAAALVATRLCPGAGAWAVLAHSSAEPGHRHLCEALIADGVGGPLLDLGLRLGEGSGAAVAVPLLRLACDLHGGMATFAEAGVAAAGADPDAGQ